MSETHADDVSKHPKIYRNVFIVLSVLTVVTVLAATFDFGVALAVALGLLIAVVKGSLVGMYFMHLMHERKVVGDNKECDVQAVLQIAQQIDDLCLDRHVER